VLRVEQVYIPTLTLTHAPIAHVVLRKRPTGQGAAMQIGDVVKDFAPANGASKDVKASPVSLSLDLRDVADGNYVFYVEVSDSARTLARPALAVVVRKGIDLRVADARARSSGRAGRVARRTALPVDRMHSVNSGEMQLGAFDVDKTFADADAIQAAVEAGKDPFAGKTGDIKRHYVLDGTNEVMPYRVYVPTNYSASTAMPLIVALHGLGATEDSFFDSYGRVLPPLAEKNGYIVVSPLGYRVERILWFRRRRGRERRSGEKEKRTQRGRRDASARPRPQGVQH